MGEDAKHDSLLDCDSSQEVPGKFLCRVLWLRLCVGGFLGGVSPCHLSSLSDSGRQRCQVRRESCVRFCWCAVSHTHACKTHKMLDYARREPINNCLLLNFLFSCIIWLCDLKNSRYQICMWGTLKEGPVFNYKNDTFIFIYFFKITSSYEKLSEHLLKHWAPSQGFLSVLRKTCYLTESLSCTITSLQFCVRNCFEAQMKTVHTVRKCESSIQLLCTVFLFQVCHSDHKYSSLPANTLKSSPWQLQGHNEHSSSTHYEQGAKTVSHDLI